MSSSHISAAESDPLSPLTVPAAAGKCDDAGCSRLKLQNGTRKFIGSYMSATAAVIKHRRFSLSDEHIVTVVKIYQL